MPFNGKVLMHLDPVARFKFMGMPINRPGGGHVPVMEKFPEGLPIDLPLYARHCMQGLELGGEGEGAGMEIEIKRLDPHTVAEKEHAFFPGVPYGIGEHADEPLDGRRTPGNECIENHLGVRCAREA